ncbi:MAG: SPOR domain-containing protein [Deltaproteobacteria bacterium]|nr:SPOR domain-containing protein [Deltaproteobacteria bacterium]
MDQKPGFPELTKEASGVADNSAVNHSNTPRLEALLLDDSDTHPVERLTGREVKAVSQPRRSLSWPGLLVLLLCLILIGAGVVFLKTFTPVAQNLPQGIQPVAQRLPIPPRTVSNSLLTDMPQEIKTVVSVDVTPPPMQQSQGQDKSSPPPDKTVNSPLYSVHVGPFINQEEVRQATETLRDLGLQVQQVAGRGQVRMIRLREGSYPADEARKRLAKLKKTINTAFLLPEADKRALYAGSFHEQSGADQLRESLEKQNISVTEVTTEIMMEGTILIALQADQQTAKQVAEHIRSRGFTVKTLAVE